MENNTEKTCGSSCKGKCSNRMLSITLKTIGLMFLSYAIFGTSVVLGLQVSPLLGNIGIILTAVTVFFSFVYLKKIISKK